MTEPAAAPTPEPTSTAPVAPAAPVEPTPAAPPADWRAVLPADLQNHPTLADTKSVESLARQHIDQSALIGRKGIIPPADDSPEEVNRYYTELGRPGDPAGYKFGSLDAAAATPEVTGFLDSLRPVFHGHGITDKQADGLTKDWLGIVAKDQADKNQAHAERAKLTVSDLQTKWGMAFDTRQELAKRAGNYLFGEEMMAQFAEAILPDGSRVGDSPGFIERLYENLGAHMDEDKLTAGSAAPAVLTPEAAQAEIKKLETDGDFQHAYLERNHPEHAVAQAKMKTLYAMANPEGGSAA